MAVDIAAAVLAKRLMRGSAVTAEGAGTAGRTLPSLAGSIAESFEAAEYSSVTFKAGTVFYRAEAAGASAPGRFGLEGASTVAEAEKLYNIAKWGNPADVLRTYALKEDTTLYLGRVAGGEGYQALIPRDLDPANILTLIEEGPLR